MIDLNEKLYTAKEVAYILRCSCDSQISRNWAAEPLNSYEKALKFIRTTTTTTGLKVTARLDTTSYPIGVKPSKAELSQISIRQKRVLPKWNYTISPQM